jgi:hypothetical protein
LIWYRDYSIQATKSRRGERKEVLHRREKERVPDGTSFKSRTALSNNLLSVFLASLSLSLSREFLNNREREKESPPSSEEGVKWGEQQQQLDLIIRPTTHATSIVSPKSTQQALLKAPPP